MFSPSKNPFWNLSLEDRLLRYQPNLHDLILIWSSVPCVVLGRFQNPWAEAPLDYLQKHGIFLVRRQSGGGCVFQDEGNVNFTFFKRGINPRRQENLSFLNSFLQTIGLQPVINERADIVLQKNSKFYKISGSACKRTKNACFHHCTLLVDSNLEQLKKALSPSAHISKSLAVKSVSSAVTTLQEINPLISRHRFLKDLKAYFDNLGIIQTTLPIDENLIRQKAECLSRWEWAVGETPKFEYIDPKGKIKIFSHKGRVISIEVEGKTGNVNRPFPMDADLLASFFKTLGIKKEHEFLKRDIGQSLILNKKQP